MVALLNVLNTYRDEFANILPFNALPNEILKLDLSANNRSLLKHKVIDSTVLSKYISEEIRKANAKIAIGGYLEDRLIYKRSPHFNTGEHTRTMHLGIDIWYDEYTPVNAPLNGKVHSFRVNDNLADYGPTIILEHSLAKHTFYTLYGHLSNDSLKNIEQDQLINAGEAFAEIGNAKENGQWPPHLHFQLINNMENHKGDYPGVCNKQEKNKYKTLCPDPSVLLKFN